MDIKQHPKYDSSKLIEAVTITPVFDGELITGYKYQHPPSGNKVWPPFIHKLTKGVKPLNTATFPNILFPIEFGYYLGVPVPLSIRKDIPPGDYIETIPNTTLYNVCTYIDIGNGWVGRHGKYQQYNTFSAIRYTAEYIKGYPTKFINSQYRPVIKYKIQAMCTISQIEYDYLYPSMNNKGTFVLPMNGGQFDGQLTYGEEWSTGHINSLTLVNGYIDGQYRTEESTGRYRHKKWVDFDTFYRSITTNNSYDNSKIQALSIGTYVTGKDVLWYNWMFGQMTERMPDLTISYINSDGIFQGPSFILRYVGTDNVKKYVIDISWYVNNTKVPFETYIKAENKNKYTLLKSQLIDDLKELGVIDIIGDYANNPRLWTEYINIINTKIIPRIDITKYPQLSTFLKLNQ